MVVPPLSIVLPLAGAAAAELRPNRPSARHRPRLAALSVKESDAPRRTPRVGPFHHSVSLAPQCGVDGAGAAEGCATCRHNAPPLAAAAPERSPGRHPSARADADLSGMRDGSGVGAATRDGDRGRRGRERQGGEHLSPRCRRNRAALCAETAGRANSPPAKNSKTSKQRSKPAVKAEVQAYECLNMFMSATVCLALLLREPET